MNLIKTSSFELAIYTKGDANSERFALVLPGKLDTKDYAHMRSHVDYLAGLGFFALSFDPPGTWESPGDISLYNMTNYLKAVDEVIEYFGNKPTFIMGHSRGGVIAMIAGTRNPNIFSYAVLMSALLKGWFTEDQSGDWEMAGFKLSKRDLPPGGGPMVKEFKLPYSFYKDQMNYDLTEEIVTCTKPKFFILGKRDDLILSSDVKETFNLLSEPKQLHELESDHDYRHYPDLIKEVNKVVADFLSNIDSKQIILRYINELNNRNYPVLDELVAVEVIVGSDKISRDQYRQQIEDRIQKYPDYFVKINKMEVKEDIVTLHWHRTGTNQETGEHLDEKLISQYKISNNKIHEVQ
jgi:pimeloyl-ACP methyl ester carboxylesterase